MPQYEYVCHPCKEIFTLMCNFDERPDEIECPNCKEKAEKKMSKTTFRLEGGGWASSGYSKGD